MVLTRDNVLSGLTATGYVADRQLATAIALMRRLERPLLLEGEAGVGKTEVAKALAATLGRPLIRLQCYEGLDANAVYEWNGARPRGLPAGRARHGCGPAPPLFAPAHNLESLAALESYLVSPWVAAPQTMLCLRHLVGYDQLADLGVIMIKSAIDVRALFFDVFGTVVDWRSSIAREAQAMLGERGIDWHTFADAWRARYQPAMEEVRAGRRPWVKLDVLHRENLLEVLAEFESRLADDEIDHLNRAWHRLDPWPDVVDGLQRLKTRYILATVSNGNVALMVDMAKHAGLPWDVILGAEVAGAYKPDPQAYLGSAALLDLPPAACMMVAAHNGDLVAARACGLRTAFVARPDEHGPGQTIDKRAEQDFDVVADSFIDLADKLGC